MKWAFAGLGALLTGILTFFGIFLFIDATVINEEDYYLLKETMIASMYDSIDIDYYQRTGEIKIIQEKFVEDFTRRFVETTAFGKEGYRIEFYDIIESPPKASVRIYGHTGEYKLTLDSDELLSYDIINELDGILLYSAKHLYSYDRYAVTGGKNIKEISGINYNEILLPEELENKSNCQIVKIEYTSSIESMEEINTFFDKYQSWYKSGSSLHTTGSSLKNSSKTLCKIETMNGFTVKNSKLNNIPVTIENVSKCNIAGIKYKITWQCEG